MVKKTPVIALTLLGLLPALGGCMPGRQAEEALPLARSLDALHTQIERWYATGQSDSLAALYAPDARIFLPNRPPVAGPDAILSHWQSMFDGYHWQVALETQSVAADGAVAVEHGRYTMVMTADGADSPLATDQGHYVLTWQATPLGWRIRFDIALSEVRRTPG